MDDSSSVLDENFHLSPEESELYQYCKQKLKGYIFMAWHLKEKWFIEELNDYRHVLELHPSETEFQSSLIDVHRHIRKVYHGQEEKKKGFGIKWDKTAGNMKIFCDSLHETPIGCFWFRLKRVIFDENEIKMQIRPVRQVDDSQLTPSSSAIVDTIPDKASAVVQSVQAIEWKEVWSTMSNSLETSAKEALLVKINRDSVGQTFKVFCMLLVGAFMAALSSVQWIGEFVIRFTKELSWLLHTINPIVVALIDLVSKVIGGFLIFLSMVWRDSVGGAGNRRAPVRPQPQLMAAPTGPPLDARYSFMQKHSEPRIPGSHTKPS